METSSERWDGVVGMVVLSTGRVGMKVDSVMHTRSIPPH